MNISARDITSQCVSIDMYVADRREHGPSSHQNPAGQNRSCLHTSMLVLKANMLGANEHVCRVNRAVFTDGDAVVVSVGEDGYARRWDVATGKQLMSEKIHDSIVTDMQVRALPVLPACVVHCVHPFTIAST